MVPYAVIHLWEVWMRLSVNPDGQIENYQIFQYFYLIFGFNCDEGNYCLTHWGWVMHICVRKLTIVGSDNGLSSRQHLHQAIIWANGAILSIIHRGAYFSDVFLIQKFSLKKMHLKMSPAKWRPCCLGLNMLKEDNINSVVRLAVGQQDFQRFC